MYRYCFIVFLFYSSASNANDYVVDYLPSSEQLRVNVCLNDSVDKLQISQRKSKRYITLNGDSGFKISGRTLKRRTHNEPCGYYLVNLTSAKKDRLAHKVGDSWLISNLAWLWLPQNGQLIKLQFSQQSQNEFAVSTPWLKNKDGYVIGNTPSHWTSRIAIGKFHMETVKVLGSELQIAILNTEKVKRRQEYKDWITQSALSITNLYGRFPVNQPQVLVIPIGSQKEAIPWAEVQRNGHPAVHFFVDSDRPIDEFYKDWTATHEFSHLLLPRIAYKDRWLSEGLASYYQYIVKSGSGALSVDQAWSKFTAGLARGRIKADRPLVQAKQTRHIYWGGAAIYFLADLSLRNSDTKQSLNTVLDKFSQLHMPSNEVWTAQRLMRTFDSISQSSVFTQLLQQHASINAFPISKNDLKTLNPKNNATVEAIFTTNR